MPDDIKSEFDENGAEVIELNDGDIEIIGPTTSASGFYVTNFETEFEAPVNKVGRDRWHHYELSLYF